MHAIDILLKKRDGLELSTEEIDFLIRAVVAHGETRRAAGQGGGRAAARASVDEITDAQLGAFLMAVFQRGLTLRELADLTRAMRFSGETFDASTLGTGVFPASGLPPGVFTPASGLPPGVFTPASGLPPGVFTPASGLPPGVFTPASGLPPGVFTPASGLPPGVFTIDKHSTGGVGDKTSLLIAPILAAAGLAAPNLYVPMISGRSLGHTGGTLDKLETIPGFDTQLSLTRMAEVLRGCHAALVGQTPRLVPADRLLYALRDHTGTVESPFLICASIMSKKLAEDLRGLVLDVKVGSGAFMPTYERSKFLAELMVETGERAGTRTVALLTAMDEPLGRFSGNWVEVWECVDLLRSVRHSSEIARMSADLIELSTLLSGWMLHLAARSPTPEAGAALAAEILHSGAAYQAWLKIVAAQGGDIGIFEDPATFHHPKAIQVLRAPKAGYLAAMDCKQVGWAVQRLGAGRSQPGAPVSAHAGIETHAKLGDRLEPGAPIFTLFTEDEALLAEPYSMLQATVQLADAPPVRQPLLREVVLKAR